ncbi:hypothetical protein [Daejeonella sp.]|jgi:hypothetical protein|uniref:hypothetical protein n=1 Tax=Daejeonella sp. TaxID=2805397 RepID=UPI003784F461
MTLLIILEALYYEDDARVVEMINNSSPIKTYPLKNKLFVVHSGFRFNIETGQAFELLIDLSSLDSPKLIHIPITSTASFPLILGLVVFKKNKFIDAFSKVIIAGVSENYSKIYPIEEKIDDIVKIKLNHSEFFIFKDDDHAVVKSFPLFRIYNKSISQKDGKFFESDGVF